MGKFWTSSQFGVGFIFAVGAALMSIADPIAHWIACIAFTISSIWTMIVGRVWMKKINFWDSRKYSEAFGIIVYAILVVPLMIYFAWPAAVQAPTPTIQGNCNNIGNNNVNCNVFVAPQRAQFTDELARQLLGLMPVKKPVDLQTIGGNEDQKIGSIVAEFLTKNGFSVQRTSIGMMAPPPDRPFAFNDSGQTYVVVVAPSAH
jgi:hypothetical protein